MIKVDQITKYYDTFCAVDNISFEIQKGEIVGLLGPNGAGKSTTLRMLTCFMLPSAGSVTIKDYSINKNQLEIKKLIGYLPESAPLYHDMLVYDYLDYAAQIREIPAEKKNRRIAELADTCGLNDVMHKSIGELSKGYKQRVGLAHAMIGDPEILILDEPTSGLDPNQIVEIRELIKKIGRQKTVILSTHILSEVEATCDRVIIINRGKIAADSTVAELKKSGSEEHFLNLSVKNADFSELRSRLSSVHGVKNIIENQGKEGFTSCRIQCGSSDEIRPAVYETIKNSGWVLYDFHQESKSLENIFRDLTREN
ncbi:MAG: hypothetical protein A2096_17335 [Spirochaetes bacterium GWF1_41_5]|nr:MAG: hypothetical protein A2096_17335 [Spirochaetes bacterium GWF1_41_5]HBE01584.1 ABC transporter [Spirochaetia bacterium]